MIEWAFAWREWNYGTTIRLAQGIFGQQSLDRLPILVDALQDAGCFEPSVLAHCHRPGPHVHVCWIVDRLLGND